MHHVLARNRIKSIYSPCTHAKGCACGYLSECIFRSTDAFPDSKDEMLLTMDHHRSSSFGNFENARMSTARSVLILNIVRDPRFPKKALLFRIYDKTNPAIANQDVENIIWKTKS